MPPAVVLLFPGQGSQWPGMGCDLLGTSVAFRSTIDECDGLIRERLGWSVRSAIETSDADRLQHVLGLQVMLFSIEIALAAVWRERGVVCNGVAGTSLGEIAAAHVCEALTLPDALDVVLARSELLESYRPKGGTVVLNVEADQVASTLAGLEDQAWIAGYNGPGTVTFSGTEPALAELLARADKLGVFAGRVRVDYPAHCPLLEPLAAPLRDRLSDIRPRNATVPFYSAVTGAEVAGEDLDASYWARNLVEPVRGTQLLDELLTQGTGVILEVTPHPIFAKPTNDAIAARSSTAIHCPTLRRNTDAGACLDAAHARLRLAGVAAEN
jgi:acyl transferase domain-containing protein